MHHCAINIIVPLPWLLCHCHDYCATIITRMLNMLFEAFSPCHDHPFTIKYILMIKPNDCTMQSPPSWSIPTPVSLLYITELSSPGSGIYPPTSWTIFTGPYFSCSFWPCCAGPRKPPRLGSPSQEDKVEISTGTQKATVGVSTLHRNIDSQGLHLHHYSPEVSWRSLLVPGRGQQH